MRKLALFLVCLVPSLVLAQGLDDIKFSSLPGDRFEVRLTFDGAPPEPQGYTIERPARIVLDFPEVVSNLNQRRFPLSFENSSSAMLLTSEGRTRLILNLSELTTYNGRVEGNDYVVEVGGVQGGYVSQTAEVGATYSPSERPRQTRGPERQRVTNIDFRRGDEGEGRIIINLSDDNVRADVSSTGEGVRLSLSNVFLPEELRRRLDVRDFATPVNLVSASYDERGTVLNIAARGEFDYMAYQADREYVISVKPLTQREIEARDQEFAYTGDRLSLNFQDIEVRSVLQIIADFTDLNLVASDTVRGRITLRLDSVPWDQALDLVLKTRGLDKRLNGNVLMVAPAAEIAERERQQLSSRQQLEELAPLRTEYIRVRYASAQAMFELFRGQRGGEGGGGRGGSGREGSQATGSVLSSRGQAIVDERTNSIILTDTSERIEAFKRLVEQIDIPIRQVMIEARIVIANTDFRREMGIRWGGVGYTTSGNRLVEVAGSTAGLDSSPASPAEWLTGQGGTLDLNENMMVDLGVANSAGSFAFSILSNNAFLDMELSALENTGYAEIVSQPKVITGDKQRATIESGTEIPYQEASASGATSTSFKEAVLKLDVTPQITPDNRVIMDLIINQDTVGALNPASGIPTIDVTQLETQVLVADGQTVVLGGIFQVEHLKGEDKVPFLGDLPFVGRLFKREVRVEEKRELLIFITPKIMADSLTN
ncbi:type IV pilus secretin PilQ [Marinimicrobium sp. ABcell2]|uniref:type IV pilus secretin PilQ n=1 Tax=Marinimicrobium sp. ABcell2 TaxID=3069751 RepID=UPI0027B77A16|nr:type IV pilus secretin PilQ family protein [Marinimicrobium sp. ABcell2]MDQ2076512.1 type IV pilus secretin PilQ family protein [Marinimicrobium sp. ABcell2]